MLSAMHRSATVSMIVTRTGLVTKVVMGGRTYWLQSYYSGRLHDASKVYVSDTYTGGETHGLMRNRGTFTDLTLGRGECLADLPGVDTDDIENSVDIELPLMSSQDNRALAALLHPFLAAHENGLSTWKTAPVGRWSRTVDMDDAQYGEWRTGTEMPWPTSL